MKTLAKITLICLCMSVFSCKKDTESKSSTKDVTYTFSPDGYSSTFIVINFKTKDTTTYVNQTGTMIIPDKVSLGDRIKIEMIGTVPGLNPNYNIKISYNGHGIGSSSALGVGAPHEIDLFLDHTFGASDFN